MGQKGLSELAKLKVSLQDLLTLNVPHCDHAQLQNCNHPGESNTLQDGPRAHPKLQADTRIHSKRSPCRLITTSILDPQRSWL